MAFGLDNMHVIGFIAVFYFSLTVTVADVNMGIFFPKIASDFSELTWAHGVNSRMYLEDSIKADEIMFLEADVSLGIVEGRFSTKEPIMAHPPLTHSDISLRDWLNEVIYYQTKGIKLDFKYTNVLEPSFRILKERYQEMNFPVWINADILPGPVRAPALPVDAKIFLQMCKSHLPHSTISPSWTTYTNSSIATSEKRLNWENVYGMVKELKGAGITQPVTFPVRAAFVGSSMEQLEWLIDVVPHSSLTVWSSSSDVVDVNDLLILRKTLPFDKVYYDLASLLREQFHTLKDRLKNIKHNDIPYLDKTLFDVNIGNNCSVIAGARAMILAGLCTVSFNYYSLSEINIADTEVFSTSVEFLDDPTEPPLSSLVFSFGDDGRSEVEIHKNGFIRTPDNSILDFINTSPGKFLFQLKILVHPLESEEDKYILVRVQAVNDQSGISSIKEFYVVRPKVGVSFKIINPDRGTKVLHHLTTILPAYASSGNRQLVIYALLFVAFVMNYAFSYIW